MTTARSSRPNLPDWIPPNPVLTLMLPQNLR
jgi:hypothetical protein